MVSPKASSGRTARGTIAFETTVVPSETGSDFQNRMVRSRRSPFSASRQYRIPTMTVVMAIILAAKSYAWPMRSV
jgi:hypothetical protein